MTNKTDTKRLTAQSRRSLQPWSWDDLEGEPDTSWLVGNDDHPVLIENGLWMIFGRYKTGKTYYAMEQAFCIAFGLDFHGLPVKQKMVAYVIAEGGKKRHQKRFAAIYEKHKEAMRAKGIADARTALNSGLFNLICSAVNLADPVGTLDNHIDNLINELEGLFDEIGAVYLDTWARMLAASGGHASDQELVPLAIASCDKLQNRFGCSIVIVAHVGHAKDAQDRPVGMNELPGALDGATKSEKEGEGAEAWFRYKAVTQRHTEDGFEVVGQLVTMKDENGDKIEAALTDNSVGSYRAACLSGDQKNAMDVLTNLGGSNISGDAWRDAVKAGGLWAQPAAANAKEQKRIDNAWRQKWKRLKEKLVEAKAISENGEAYSIIDPKAAAEFANDDAFAP
jgi:AAA domain